MKNRTMKLTVALAIMAMALTGCSGGKLTKDDDPKKILKEAAEKLAKEEYWGSETERVYQYDNEAEETEIVSVVFDKKNGIRQEITEYEMGFSAETFNVKEKDGYYVYVQDGEEEGSWVRYKEDEDAETDYEYYEKGIDFSFDKEEGFENVKYSNEGEEDLDGKKAIKIKITADVLSVSEEDEESEEITRKDILEENGWTEDEVALVDGFSEILDNYVKAANETGSDEPIKYEQYVWVDASEHTILQNQTNTIMGEAQESASNEAFEAFNNAYWQMDMVHSNLEEGMSKEEVVEMLKEEKAAMEEESEDEWGDEEEYPNQTAEISTECFLTKDECPDLDEVPQEYEEMTEEEYYSGIY